MNKCFGSIDKIWLLFIDWMVYRDVATLLALLEHAEYFDPQSYNPAFEGELEKLIARIQNPELRRQVSELRGFDWGGYLAGCLRKAGFRDADLQDGFHSIAVKMLVTGKLFSGWNPQKHGPIRKRYFRSVWNGIRNLVSKDRHRRKWFQVSDPTVMAGQYAARQPHSDALDDFRKVVEEKLGSLALAILDAKLSGRNAKSLEGNPDLGSPSIYYIKQSMHSLKRLAQEFAVKTGNTEFINLLDRAMESQAATVMKRKATVAARSA